MERSQIHIAVDAMGGDFAPQATVKGAFQAAVDHRVPIFLVGQRQILEEKLDRLGDHGGLIEIVHAEEVVGMEDPPITPIRKKRDSSVRICAELVKEGRAQAMMTAGNTGAAMVVAKMVIGAIKGVDRPALAAVLPNPQGSTVVLDVGANVASRASHLRQFAVMGYFYAQEILGTNSPRVGLMSVGEEETKGTDLTRQVFQEMQATGFNFIGNIEGSDVFKGTVDVVVCDGFVGNVILKSAEGLAEAVASMMREELDRSWRSRLGYLLAKPAFLGFRRRVDYREYGAAPLLGVEGGCFIGHGRSNPKAVRNSILRAVEFCEADLHIRLRDKVADLHDREERLSRSSESQEVEIS